MFRCICILFTFVPAPINVIMVLICKCLLLYVFISSSILSRAAVEMAPVVQMFLQLFLLKYVSTINFLRLEVNKEPHYS